MKKTKETNKEKEEKILSRGRRFEGIVKKKFHNRIVIFFERLLFVPKYERYEKRKTVLHARLPEELKDSVNVGDLVEIKECRPISKTIHFIVTKKIRSANETNNS